MDFTPIRDLNDHQLKQVTDWLKSSHNLVYNEKRLLHDFSDCVNVAKILKTIHPKLVDLHNYPSRCNTELKINNWETLNFKVLSKIGLSQNAKKLAKLARGDQQAIQSLLYDILRHERVDRLKQAALEEQERNNLESNGDVLKININKRIGDAVIQVPQKMILYSSYEDAVKRNTDLGTYIAEVQRDIEQLEALLEVKNRCIEDLRSQVSMHTTVTQASLKEPAPDGSVGEEQSKKTATSESSDKPPSEQTSESKLKIFESLSDQNKKAAMRIIKTVLNEVHATANDQLSSSPSVSSLSTLSDISRQSSN